MRSSRTLFYDNILQNVLKYIFLLLVLDYQSAQVGGHANLDSVYLPGEGEGGAQTRQGC